MYCICCMLHSVYSVYIHWFKLKYYDDCLWTFYCQAGINFEHWRPTRRYLVVKMKRDMFFSVSDIVRRCTLRKTSVNGNKVQRLKMQWLQIKKSSPLKLFFKYSVQEDVDFDCVDFSKKERASDVLSSLKQALCVQVVESSQDWLSNCFPETWYLLTVALQWKMTLLWN